MPFADAATGVLVLSGAFSEGAVGSISQFFRMLVFLQAFLLLERGALLVTAILMLYVLIFELAILFVHQQTSWFFISLVYAFKLIYLIVVYLAFRRLEINHRSFDVVKHFVNSAILCGLILMVTTAVGLNYATYDEGTFGSKGLFASGNGLSITDGSVFQITQFSITPAAPLTSCFHR